MPHCEESSSGVVSGGSLDASRASSEFSDTAIWRVDGGRGDNGTMSWPSGVPLAMWCCIEESSLGQDAKINMIKSGTL